MSDGTKGQSGTLLPQRAIDAGWRYARGDNGDALDLDDTQTIRDFELAYENVDSGLLIVGRGQSNDEAYRDALSQMGIEPD